MTVELPDDIEELLEDEEGITLIALELYREGRISGGKAAELTDLTYDEFMDELESRDMKLNAQLNPDEIETIEEYVK